jgi:3-isopropylmalate/(R)-2-methylmalate dehydratase large subunit
MGMTLAQKVLARSCGRDRVDVGDVINVEPDLFSLIDLVLPHYLKTLAQHGVTRLRYPGRCVVFSDHEVPAQTVRVASLQKALKQQMRDYGIGHFYQQGRHGISHQAIVEYGHVLPGMLVLCADTHGTTLGCVGALSPPINYEMIQALAAGEIWLQVPETIQVVLHGRLRPGVMSRDVALHIGRALGPETCDYRVIEYTGPAMAGLGMDARMTLCNAAVDMGAKAAVVPADEVTRAYLQGRTQQPWSPVLSDADAVFSHRLEVDLSRLEPQVAAPPTPANLVPISSLSGVAVDQVYIGSCGGGRMEDLVAAAEVLRGRKVHEDVRMLVVPTSQEIYEQAGAARLLEVFARAGALVLTPSCGPCYGNLSPLVDGEVCIGTGTTNMPGRMGSARATIYLANAAVSAACAVAGSIVAPDELPPRSVERAAA